MNINLPQNIEASLRQQAIAAGIDIEQFVILALQSGLANSEMAPSDAMLAGDKWKEKFDLLLSRFPVRQSDSRVDCSRESIYGDHGR